MEDPWYTSDVLLSSSALVAAMAKDLRIDRERSGLLSTKARFIDLLTAGVALSNFHQSRRVTALPARDWGLEIVTLIKPAPRPECAMGSWPKRCDHKHGAATRMRAAHPPHCAERDQAPAPHPGFRRGETVRWLLTKPIGVPRSRGMPSWTATPWRRSTAPYTIFTKRRRWSTS